MPLILLVASEREALHKTVLAGRITSIQLNPPDWDERKAFADTLFNIYQERGLSLEEGVTSETLATFTAGLLRLGIEDIVVRCATTRRPLDFALIRDRKQAIMESAFGGLLETEMPEFGFEAVTGHDEIKDYLRRSIIECLLTDNVQRVPKGILLVGPAGTGKTLLAKALAKETRVNFVNLQLQNLKNRYVGASEENLRKVLDVVRANVPCVLFIDEFDTAFPNRARAGSDSSGVDSSLLGYMLPFLSDPALRGKVLTVAASNKPGEIDPALRRPGRIDKIVPVLPPVAEVRRQFLTEQASRLGSQWEADVDFDAAVTATNWYTQAELEMLLLTVYEVADDANHPERFTQATLDEALDIATPSTDAVQQWTNIAIEMCNDKRFLPYEWREYAKSLRTVRPSAPAITPAALEMDYRPRGGKQ